MQPWGNTNSEPRFLRFLPEEMQRQYREVDELGTPLWQRTPSGAIQLELLARIFAATVGQG
jgi:hypothetical protein